MAEFSSLNGYAVKDTVARNIAKGRNQAVAFNDYQSMIETLNTMEKEEYKAGQNIYIGVVGVPDLWVYSVEDIRHTLTYVSDEDFIEMLKTNTTVQVGFFKLAMLEGQKVDLTTYDQKLAEHTENIASLNERLGDISSIGNETYNSFEKLLRYYIDNDFLPDVNMIPLIPPMTSNTKPSGEASANGIVFSYLRGVRIDEPYVIFAGVSDSEDSRTYFDLDGSNADRYIQYKFDSPKIVKKVSLENNYDGEQYYVKTFKIQASTDGVVFNDITGEIAHSKGANLLEYHNIYNNNPYIAYRFIPLTYGNVSGTIISCGPRLQFYGY